MSRGRFWVESNDFQLFRAACSGGVICHVWSCGRVIDGISKPSALKGKQYSLSACLLKSGEN